MGAAAPCICSANDTPFTRSNTIPQRPSICCTLQTVGTGSPRLSTAAWIAASRNVTRFEPVDRRCPTKFHDAGAPFEHLGPLAGREQTAHGFAHLPPRATGMRETHSLPLGSKDEAYMSSQTSSMRQPL